MKLKDFGIAVIPSGAGLKYIRSQMGLTQTALASELGLSLTTISRWERGKFEPTRSHREALENYCLRMKIPYQQYQIGILAVRLVNNYDAYTAEHCHRVCLIAGEMGKRVRGIELIELRIAAVLHDVGKLICRRGLIRKRGKFNLADRTAIKEHTAAGEMLVNMLMLAHPRAAEIVGQHHERLDGGGYRGLTAAEILPEAQVIAVADVYDALTTTRSYKPALTVEETIEKLRADGGLNQRLVHQLERAVRRDGFLDSLESDSHIFEYRDRQRFYSRGRMI